MNSAALSEAALSHLIKPVSVAGPALRLLFCGPPGIAKTARLESAAALAGMRTITATASLMERADAGGALWPDPEKGVCRLLPLPWLAEVRAATSPTLLILDDIGQAPVDVQAALMPLFAPGTLPPCVTIAGATNRPQDKAGVSALCEPLRSRFHLKVNVESPAEATQRQKTGKNANGSDLILPWSETLDAWLDYAAASGIPALFTGFHARTGGKHLYDWQPNSDPGRASADLRAWHTAATLYVHQVKSNAPDTFRDLLPGIVGSSAAEAFRAWLDLLPRLPNPADICRDPIAAPLPESPELQSVTVHMLANLAGRNPTPANIAAVIRYTARLERADQFFLHRSLTKRAHAVACTVPEFQAFAHKHSASLATVAAAA